MLITCIDKVKNSICKGDCGYVLGGINIPQPMNFIFMKAAEIFPIDYILMVLLVLFFFSSSIAGIASIGIRFLWVRLFEIRKGHSPPQALLMATVMLSLIVLAVNYSITMIVAPQYSIYGPQTFCQNPPKHPGEQPDCSHHPELVKPCSELSRSDVSGDVCTPSVVSTFLNRVTLNFPFLGALAFWAQFAFLAVFLLVFLTALIRTPRLNVAELDDDAETAEEEGLLSSTGRRLGATWQDITGRPAKPSRSAASTGAAGRGVRGQTQDDED
jgi:LMBR1 domain-containing protein 1